MVKLSNIQVLRGIVALFVCVFHSRFLVNIANKDEVLSHIKETVGIPLFYVISGFVMVFVTQNVPDNPAQAAKLFLIKRLLRIVPLFYFSLFLAVNPHNLLLYFTAQFTTLFKTIFFIPLFTHFSGPAYGFSFMYVSWSLNYEILFYVVFSVSMLFSRLRYHFLFLYYLTFLFLMPLLSKGYVTLSPSVNYGFSLPYLNFFTNPIQLFFVSGILFGTVVIKYNNHIKKAAPWLIYGSFIVSVIYMATYAGKIMPSFPASDLILCSMLIYTLVLMNFRFEDRHPKFLLYLGNISYCIYLLHPIIYLYLVGLVRRFGLYALESSWYFVPVSIVVVVAVAIVTHELVEKKCIHYLRSRLVRPQEKQVVPANGLPVREVVLASN